MHKAIHTTLQKALSRLQQTQRELLLYVAVVAQHLHELPLRKHAIWHVNLFFDKHVQPQWLLMQQSCQP